MQIQDKAQAPPLTDTDVAGHTQSPGATETTGSDAMAKGSAMGRKEPASAGKPKGPSFAPHGMPAPHVLHDDPLLGCLVELTRIHGNPQTAQALTHGLPLVEHRLTPSLLARAARRAHCTARVVRRSLNDLPPNLLPSIALLDGNRAALLLQVLPQRQLLVQYPESDSPVAVDRDAFSASYSGVMCFVRPIYRVEQRAAQQGQAPARLHWFRAAIMENWRLYRDALVAAVLINVLAMAMPIFTMNVYDRVVPHNAVESLWVMAVGIVLVLLFNFVLTTLRAYIVDVASKRIDVKLSAQIMERVLDLRMEVRPASVGSFASNLRSFESVRDFIASASLTTLVDLPFAVLFLGMLAWISPWMLLPLVIAMGLMVAGSMIAKSRMEALSSQSFQAASQRNAVLVESLTNLEAVKTLNAQGVVQRVWESSTEYLAYTGGKVKLISSATVGLMQVIQQLVSVMVVITGVYLVQQQAMSMGGIIAASMLAGRCLGPLGQVAGLMMQYQMARASLQSVDTYMNMPVERAADKEYVSRPHLCGAIEFRNVSFTYPGSKQAVLSDVSFKLEPGERVGVIGRIGSGKSTLEKLILGLYQPTAGAVLVDGVDVRQIDPGDLRQAIGHVPQDPMLFYGSLKHNLLIGAPFASDDDMLRVAALAGVNEFADLHPDGYDMLIGERGESLSGGQRQSIAVARAMIHDPSVLLLDEPSSNLDNQSEALLKRRLLDGCDGKTMLLVTHRTALLELVDRLMVIEEGQIVADGAKDQVVQAIKQGRIGRARTHT